MSEAASRARVPDLSLARLLPALALALSAAAPAPAVDGVLEINDAAALAGNVTPGDAAGYPVTVSQAGSYRLTGDLVVRGSANLAALEITADHVSLDLNGFSITCAGPTCSGGGTGDGIFGPGQRHVSVRNGFVRGMADNGIELGEYARLEDLRVVGNLGDGVAVSDGSRIERCTIAENGAVGLVLSSVIGGDGVLLFENQITDNASFGLSTSTMQTIRWAYNVVSGNNNFGSQASGSPSGFPLDRNYCPDSSCPTPSF